MSSKVAEIFGQASELSDLAIMMSGPIGTVAKVASLAFRAARAFAEAGHDPVVEIRRILSVIPEVTKVNNEFEAAIDQEFTRRAQPVDLLGGFIRDNESPAPLTLPSSIGRHETEPSAPPSSIGRHETEPSMPAVIDEEAENYTPEDI